VILTPGAGQRKLVYKEASQDVVSSTVLVDDAHIIYPVDMDHRYAFELEVYFQLLGIVSGYSFALSAPGQGLGTLIEMSAEVMNGVTGATINGKVDVVAPMTISGALATIGRHRLRIKGLMQIATGFTGNFKLQFAQNVSDVGAIRVNLGTSMEIEDYA